MTEFFQSKNEIEQRFFERLVPVVESVGLSIYDLEYASGSSTLRVYIQNLESKTATLADCVTINHATSSIFEEDWIPENIILEVSSPGLYRAIRSKEHLLESVGQRALFHLNVSLLDAVGGQNLDALKGQIKEKKVIGYLREVQEEQIILGIELKKSEMKVVIPINYIKKANWEPKI